MIKTAIIYNHRGRFGKDGAGPIEVRVTHDRRAYYINTGVCVRPREWKFGKIVKVSRVFTKYQMRVECARWQCGATSIKEF